MKRLLAVAAFVVIFLGALFYRPLTMPSRQVEAEPADGGIRVDFDAALAQFSESISAKIVLATP